MNKHFLKTGMAIFALAALPTVAIHAQKSVIETNIANEKAYHSSAAYSLFGTAATRDNQIDHEINNVVYLKLNKQVFQQLLASKDPLIQFSLPLQGGSKQFTLNNFNILDDGFKVWEQGANGQRKEVNVDLGVFYRGIMEGASNSIAAFTFNNEGVAAVFSTVEGGNYNLVLNYNNPGADRDNYILFREADIVNGHRAKCAVPETEDFKKGSDNGATAEKGAYNSCHKLRVSMHGDYLLYQHYNNSTSAAVAYLTSLFNVDAALYNNEGINAVMSEAVVNSTPDNYTYGGSEELLFKFGDNTQSNFVGDITQLVTAYTENGWAPLGGLAWLDVICQDPMPYIYQGDTVTYGPYSIVDNDPLPNIPQVPIYSWDAEASTHEMGHNIGSPHTQSCSWPGGPIDNCYPQEGTCAPGPNIPVNTGTIMSYCHLSNVGINFAYGFGPLPGNRIRNNVATRSCMASFKPTNTITTANIERIANRQCTDGYWTYYYYDNNTATESDDVLLLELNTNGQDIGDVDVTGVTIKMTTQSYGSGSARTVTAPYADANWKEFNRTWNVTLPTGTQPTTNVTVRFPFMTQDVTDMQGSFPTATTAGLKVVAFTNAAAAATPAIATASDVDLYTSGSTASTTQWKLSTEGNYQLAEFITNSGIFGGSIGFENKPTPPPTGINEIGNNKSLVVYPNPASSTLNIRIPDGAKVAAASTVIIDNLGRIINVPAAKTFNNGTAAVDISGLSAGVYCLRMVIGGEHYNGYFVKK